MNEQGIPSRPPASAFLFVDSRDRFYQSEQPEFIQIARGTSQPLNDFIIQKQQPINTGFFTRIGLTELKFPWYVPNINERNNEFLYTQYSTTTSVFDISTIAFSTLVQLPEAFYTPQDIADTVTFQVNTNITSSFSTLGINNPSSFEMVWNGEFSYFSLATNAPNPYGFFSLTASPTQARGGLVSVLNLPWDYSIADNIPFPAISYESQPTPRMCYTDYVDICSRKLTQYQNIKDNSTRENQTPGVLARVYLNDLVNSGFGYGSNDYETIQFNSSIIRSPAGTEKSWFGCSPTIIYRDFTVPKYSTWSPGQFVDQIDIQLRDDNGDLLYIPYQFASAANGATQFQNFQMTLHVSET
jgi:hypothetical protein